ncbi:unnamed protein product [Schistocephalus solidus]|nr:unnamed protein product [Schistocephalus solidus]
MLECHNCRLRQIYHALTAIELRRDENVLSCSPLRPRRHFHQLARLIKAVLRASDQQRKWASSKRRTSRHRQPLRPWICQGHGRDLFQYLFYADEDAYDSGKNRNVTRSQWAGTIFPKGQSEFYDKGRSIFEDDEGQSEICFSARVECKPISSVDMGPCLSQVTQLLESLNVDPFSKTDSESVVIQEANRRWFEAYASDPEPRRKASTKCVHFPNFSPVTSVHNLITYSCASRLQRADRTWEIDAMRRETPPPEHKTKTLLCDEIIEKGFADALPNKADVHVSLTPFEIFPQMFSYIPPISEPSCPTMTVNSSLSSPNTESKPGIDSSGLLPEVIACELTVSAAFPKRRRRRRKHRNRTANLKPSVSPILSDLPCISLDWPSCTNTFYSEQMRSLDSILSHEMCSFPLTASCCYTTPNLAKSQKYF